MSNGFSLLTRFGWVVLLLPVATNLTSCTSTTTNVTDVIDTVRVPFGTPPVSLVGLVVGDIPDANFKPIIDSCYSYIAVTTNPAVRRVTASVNGHTLVPPGANPVIGGFIPGRSPAPDPLRSELEGRFTDTSTNFAFRAVVPYYADSSALTLSYDTLADAIGLPSATDSVKFSNGQGLMYDSVDLFTLTDSLLHRVPLDRDLYVSWQGTGDWFGIECRKYIPCGNTYCVTGALLDTFTTAKTIGIPRDYIFQDTAVHSSTYLFLYVSVVAVNGPRPNQWNSPTSFGGKGFLLGLRGIPAYGTAMAFPTYKPQGGVGKRLASGDETQLPLVKSVDILSRLFARLSGASVSP